MTIDSDAFMTRLALAYRTLARAHLGRTEQARADLAALEKLAPALPAPPAPLSGKGQWLSPSIFVAGANSMMS